MTVCVCITNRRCHVFTAVHLNGARECVPMIFISQDSTPTPRMNVKKSERREKNIVRKTLLPLGCSAEWRIPFTYCARNRTQGTQRQRPRFSLNRLMFVREALSHFIFVFLRFSTSIFLPIFFLLLCASFCARLLGSCGVDERPAQRTTSNEQAQKKMFNFLSFGSCANRYL